MSRDSFVRFSPYVGETILTLALPASVQPCNTRVNIVAEISLHESTGSRLRASYGRLTKLYTFLNDNKLVFPYNKHSLNRCLVAK